ncbi:MAG: flagellar hook-length control protein FliK [Ralstonia sp.]|uniref:Flagellar hook-length control protein-like C-terminal domain-containing protein n=3 Tax=Ralstonia TaxID=48736 RepID=A0ABN9HWY9_RALPI|nr:MULTISPECIES: flagellar hook-length control protein FliK [Ralstonia]MBA4014773.1 flagellar hook-length control protein FliK [Ralstonia sp.]MBA4200326.1 flagellar hook-length control protein FliK [Ralstonia sp.]MBA4229416.1 flagellar hook-length control protein FliK [Ralstonia sp.]MBA4237309.1 flagellar hook-length control protein FliK [Ralstonia sp.]MBA4400868.1 flagellar hook-length control protein FliK [Ralstonia sp.]
MGLSATPNAAAKDLGAMLSAGNTAAADKTQASSSGTDTFGNLLSDRMAQDAARRRADAQSTADDAARRADIARKDATRTSAVSNDQDAKPADGNTPVPSITTPAASTADTATAKPSQPASAKDLDTAAKQAAVDPAAQLAAQIEAARQAAQLPVALPAAPSTSNTDTDATSSAASKSPANGAAALAAASAAANGAQGSADPAAMAQAGLAGLPAAKDAKANAANTPTPPATALPDSGTLAQAMARTRAAADNTPAAVRQLGSASSGQGANADRGLPRRDLSPHNAPAQPAAAAVTDAISHASNGGNTGNTDNAGTQSNAQGNGMQFQGVLSRATGDGGMAAPTFAVGGANAGAAAGASITPQQVHTLPTFGDAAWPQSMASQLAFMQVHRQSSAELQLNPAELGGMHVKLEVDNGAVNASFVCQHQAVAELVQDAMPRLRDAMQQGGMQLAQTSVSTGDFSQQQNASQGSSAQNQGSGSGNGGSGSRYGSSGSQDRPDTVTAAPRRVSRHEGAIDTFA